MAGFWVCFVGEGKERRKNGKDREERTGKRTKDRTGQGEKGKGRNGSLSLFGPPLLDCAISMYKNRKFCGEGTGALSRLDLSRLHPLA